MTLSPVQIRPASAEHLREITAIYNHEVLNGTATFDTDARSEDEIGAWLLGRGKRFPSRVALEGAVVVGFAGLFPWSARKGYDETAEDAVYARADRRGVGIGEQLLRAILEEGREAGLHSIIAKVTTDNLASIRLHRKFGFERVGTLKEVGFKLGRRLDVELMQRIF